MTKICVISSQQHNITFISEELIIGDFLYTISQPAGNKDWLGGSLCGIASQQGWPAMDPGAAGQLRQQSFCHLLQCCASSSKSYMKTNALNKLSTTILSKKPAAAAAAAKSLQSCPTLCNPIDGSLPGSPIPGILQASFS